jgi:hypothetical protein
MSTSVGLFDFLTKKNAQTAVQRLAAKAADKRGMAPDRWEALQALTKIDSEEAVEALLLRFTFYVDPTITDQEEKDSVFNAVVAKGSLAVAPLKRFIRKAESLSWPLKMLEQVLPAEEVLSILLDLLRTMDTEYERDPQRKLQVLAELEARRGPQVVEAVMPFLKDVHEPARFHAVGAVLAQEAPEAARAALAEACTAEDSMRIKGRILDGFASHGWSMTPAQAGRLPDGFTLDAKGVPRRR